MARSALGALAIFAAAAIPRPATADAPADSAKIAAIARESGRAGSEAIDRLAAYLREPSPFVRAAAATALGSRERSPGEVRRVTALLVPLLRDSADVVRREAVVTLGLVHAEDAIDAIRALIANPENSSETRAEAIVTLGRLRAESARDDLIRALGDDSSRVRVEAAWALGGIGGRKSVPPLIRALDDSVADVRIEAAKALAAVGDRRATEPLARLLADDRRTVRWEAAHALGMRASPSALPALVRALGDSASEVRAEAVRALGTIGRQDALAPLADRLRHDDDAEVRTNAALVLGELGNRWAVPALCDALRDDATRVRWAAATSLGVIGDERARGPLERLVGTETWRPAIVAARLALLRLDQAKGK